MNAKKLMVSFLTIACILAVVATVTAGQITTDYKVEINGVDMPIPIDGVVDSDISVVAGELLEVEVTFTATLDGDDDGPDTDDTDVTLEAELEGDKVDVDAITQPFDVLAGKSYKKTLTLRVPYELKDEVNDGLTLELELDGEDHKTVLNTIILSV